jgi:tRNA CCA-adding enzyme
MIHPEPEEYALLTAIAERMCERVRSLGAEAIIGGSFAKDTWLSGSRDIDIFARFDVQSEAELLERTRTLFEAFPEAEIVKGSREYLRIDDDVTVEIIPIRPLGENANTMDHSVDHITYVTEHLTSPHDVRVLKALLRAHRIYGAESHVRGFSGYVCELLIIAYGSLEALAQEASTWDLGARVSLRDDSEPFDDVLIVEDPTDRARNAAAAVDERSLRAFITLMKRIDTGEALDTLMREVLLEPPYARVRMRASHEKRDVGFAKLRAIHDRLTRSLRPFGVKASQWHTDEDVWESRFALEHFELDRETTRTGPPISLEKAARAFTEHHPEAYEKDGVLIAPIERDETSWTQIVDRVCTHPDVASYEAEVVM